MISQALAFNKMHSQSNKRMNSLYKKINQRKQRLNSSDPVNRGFSLCDDTILIKYYLTYLYYQRVQKRAIKSMTIEFSDESFRHPEKNVGREELIDKVLAHFEKHGLKTKLKVYNHYARPHLKTYTVKLTTEI